METVLTAFITTGLTNGGVTTHYQFQYDDSLNSTTNPGQPEPARTNAVIAACENDFNLMAGWFGNIALDVNTPIPVNVTPNGGGAGWSLSGSNLTITINPGSGVASFIRYLLVAEMTETFMRIQNRGWFGQGTEGSQGEGLSRFLAAQFLSTNGLGNPPAAFSNSNSWLSSSRADNVNNINPTDDGPDAITGCSLLFIYYLFTQLGFSINNIVAAGASNLAGVYKNLTGDASDPFPFFKQLLDTAFPGTSTITGPNLDNPFPLGILSFWVDKNTFGRDEVADVIASSSNGRFPNAFWLVLEGFNINTFNSLGIVNAVFSGPFNNLPQMHITMNSSGLEFEDPTNTKIPQRIRFPYDITFSNVTLASFPNAGSNPVQEVLNALIDVGGNALLGAAAITEFELVSGADPYFTNIDPNQNNVFWLSQDLRVFTATPGMNNTPVAGGPLFSSDSVSGAFDYIQQLLTYLNNNFSNPSGVDPFNSILPGQAGALTGDSSVTPFTYDFSNLFHPKIYSNYNFAIARVRLRGTAGAGGAANNVKTFFRLWSTQSADTDYHTDTTYPSTLDSKNLPNLPLVGSDHHTIPFFATGNLPGNADYAAGGVNNRTIQINSGDSIWAYFGCFLNLYDSGNTIDGQQVQHWLNGTHHCIVAQIAYDDAPIINSNGVTMNPENSDKLAQRNLQVTTSDNPGPAATHIVPQTFDLRPSKPIMTVPGMLLNYPDELMIDWGKTPIGSIAHIYWPQVNAAQVLDLATKIYGAHLLSASDGNTIDCAVTKGVTYVPIPPGTGQNFASLITVDLPPAVKTGQEFNIIVRRVSTRLTKNDFMRVETRPRITATNKKTKGATEAANVAPTKEIVRVMRNWRYVVGTFQIKIPVSTKEVMLFPEENTLAILKWRLQSMSPTNRWYSVLQRYISYVAARVNGLGGNAATVKPSLHGVPPKVKSHDEEKMEFTGKVSGLVYDRFGDFEGFLLDTEDGERRFYCQEIEIELVIRRAWAERIMTTVYVERDEPHHPLTILLRNSPHHYDID
ncbi:MAG: hypothetical protein ACREA3_03880 [Nitrosotalea sp.]